MTEKVPSSPSLMLPEKYAAEARRKLAILAEMDKRATGAEIVALIEAEYARRFSAPSLITIAEAEAAAAKVEA